VLTTLIPKGLHDHLPACFVARKAYGVDTERFFFPIQQRIALPRTFRHIIHQGSSRPPLDGGGDESRTSSAAMHLPQTIFQSHFSHFMYAIQKQSSIQDRESSHPSVTNKTFPHIIHDRKPCAKKFSPNLHD
jgi:hypothetical protein